MVRVHRRHDFIHVHCFEKLIGHGIKLILATMCGDILSLTTVGSGQEIPSPKQLFDSESLNKVVMVDDGERPKMRKLCQLVEMRFDAEISC